MDLSNVSVEAAVRVAQAQEKESAVSPATQVLRECLEANYDRLLRRLSRSIGCSDTASDSLHEAWVRLGSATLPEAIHRGETYVFRMAYNLAVDQMRARQMCDSLADESEVFDVLPDRGPGPEAVAGARSELAALSRALDEMSGHHRRVLVELRIDDLTREEVAARYGLSLRKVDTLLRQTLDYCAMQTGRQAAGGISQSRRPSRRGAGAATPAAPHSAHGSPGSRAPDEANGVSSTVCAAAGAHPQSSCKHADA